MSNTTAIEKKARTNKTRNHKPETINFNKYYKILNPAQKLAVDTLEGPVMVIAGPGTGKTQVVAMRVANILEKTQMRPSNILCLTFSTSGVKAMRERLREIIGSDAYGVTVETVHGFCNEIILTHPHIFEDFNALEQISDIERLRTVQNIIKKLPPGSVLSRPSRDNSRAAAIISRISEMKREGISVKNIRSIIPTYQSSIETTSSGKERSKDSQAYRNDLRLVRQFEEFCNIYEKYNEEMKENQRYDYEDMILFVTEALKTNDNLLAQLQERFQYILVDEYQDLNGSQAQAIELLTKEPTPDHLPNIFIVGDDDQAIYRFQGASIKNMLEFTERFPQTKMITLTENYRSTQEILDTATELIGNNGERLVGRVEGVEKSLKVASGKWQVASGQCQAIINKPSFLRYPSTETERAGVAEILREAHKNGIEWNEIAVLCRTNNELNDMHDVLTCAEVPVVLTSKQDLLLHPKVREIFVLLRAVENPNDNAVLSAALGCEVLELHPADLGKLWCAFRRQRTTKSLRDFMLNSEEFAIFNFQTSIIERLHAQRQSKTLPDLIESALKDFGLLPRKDDTSADPRTVAAMYSFYDYVKNRSYEQKNLTLIELLADLEQYLTEPQLKLEYDMPHITENGVQLMTAHAAKGMEFRLVVIPHVRYSNWGDRRQGSSLSLPDNLIYKSNPDSKTLKQEDERRLMYVAMTRAKENMIITFSETYRSGEEVRDAQVASFVAEVGNEIDETRIPAEEVPHPIEVLWKPKFKIDEAFEAFLRERLETFDLSVTALNAFLENPQAFLWTHFLRMPQAKAPNMSFGSAVHHALEMRNRAWQKGEPFDTKNLIAAFEEGIKKEILTKHEIENYLHDGKEILEKYESLTSNIPLILSTERTIKASLIDPSSPIDSGIPLVGKIDRIDLFHPNGQKCRVIDYKTGNTRKTEAAVRKEDRLFRQLTFYKILCDLSPSFTHTATLFTLDFVGNPKDGRSVIDVEITDKEVDDLKDLICKVWSKIIALDFTPL